ncbi:TOBE domain-containing protein [Gephyromycinifex aptenodytis]|uniref:TOBE domain-containing protein n=1 Tax=Gephyromycinifex aptenodytis TaxID=2716227 RepID=UPI0014480891|nr:TOBE domain-containing protein [Gephyromycinifex aptenodytis]
MSDPAEVEPPTPGRPTTFRVREAAMLVGVSDDTLRRWIDRDELAAGRDEAGRVVVDGLALIKASAAHAARHPQDDGLGSSARNRFTGIVTDVVSDRVMSQVQLRCGPFTVTSLMSTESVHRLGLVPGALATAVVKATNVVIETPGGLSS